MTFGEKDFLKNWPKQREEPRWKFYLRNGLLPMILVPFGVEGLNAFQEKRPFLQDPSFFLLLLGSMIIAGLGFGMWIRWSSDKKYQKLLREEEGSNA